MDGRKLRVGHAGTLDPLATGVLTICTGRATRRIEDLQGHQKEYVAELRLGATTASFDLEQPIDQTFDNSHITLALIEEALPKFIGDIRQTPPIFSACKVNGDRSYDLARKGRDVKLEAKPIRIDAIEIEEFKAPDYLRIRVVCGKGTYIRALARDIGEALGSGAHLLSLRRTRVGNVRVEDCWTLPQFEAWIKQQHLETELPDCPVPKNFPTLAPPAEI